MANRKEIAVSSHRLGVMCYQPRFHSKADIRFVPGYGTVSPLIVRHRMWLNACSSATSSKSKSSFADSRASRPPDGFFASSDTDGTSAVYGLRSGSFDQI